MPARRKREEELAYPREKNGAARVAPITHGELQPVTRRPLPDPQWHPIATGIYDSVQTSGEVSWYQDSDWWMLYNLCEELSDYKKQDRRNGQILSSILSALDNLLLTEAARRKARIELQRPPEPKPDLSVVAINTYQSKMKMQGRPSAVK